MLARFFAALVVSLVTVGALAAQGKENDPIKRAIRGGQNNLQAIYRPGGPGPFGAGGRGIMAGMMAPGAGLMGMAGQTGLGSPALAGLALLESGIPPNDATVANITRVLRQGAFSTKGTYELSLLIMYFDRLGQKEDRGMIQFLTVRLMGGQVVDGTWTYLCDGMQLDAVEERQLRSDLAREPRDGPGTPPPAKKDFKPRADLDPRKKDSSPKPKEEPKSESKDMDPSLERYARQFEAGGAGRGSAHSIPIPVPGGLGSSATGDHSNTQFATVGLWCGRRHGVNVANCLKLVDKHYRGIQAADGGWGYTSGGGHSSPSMTCAGLMGMAMGFGARNLDAAGRDLKAGDPNEVAKDAVVAGGLKYVGNMIASVNANGNPRNIPPGGDPPLTADLYFMWSLERVGMVYGLKTIGNLDWYDWGSKILVSSQNGDGSWTTANHSMTPDNATAFALLFLSRANLADDLSASLTGRVKDPGTSRLISPGDLDALLAKGGRGSASPSRPDKGTRPKDVRPAPVENLGRLAAALIAASGAERAKMLESYRDTKGAEYTDALAQAIPKLAGESQTQAREALAARLARMTPTTLNGMMEGRDRELRLAAAVACSSKAPDRITEFGAKLVDLIGDDDTTIVQAARASLKALSGEDFGPAAGAASGQRTQALLAWQKWLTSRTK